MLDPNHPLPWTLRRDGFIAIWEGGAYIDVSYDPPPGEPVPAPFTCINVWDYRTDTPALDSPAAFHATVADHLGLDPRATVTGTAWTA